MSETTIRRWGNSQGIRIPRHILEAAALRENESVTIEAADGAIIIRKAAEKRTIKALFEGFEGEYKEKEVDFGAPAGNEVW
ncbi:MAG: AbrB/MazE/SpoVT family DNA-binding domain-containing protein [Clostridia bacterium]|nr:AbrB/MazE/SpoVT family DNA-binding domain-containing protein [Clostridia bacterium]